MTFEQLEPEYARDLASMKVTASDAAVTAVARGLLKSMSRFLTVQEGCGVPALWLMPVFEREGPSFNDYFGNGDPLNRATVHVPKGRGPFQTWEDGVMDALRVDDVSACKLWTWESMCYEFEKWNGFGPRNHGRPSGYLWSGTNVYVGGKYVADGVWSRGTWDKQLGCIVVAKKLLALEPSLVDGIVENVQTVAETPHPQHAV